EILGGKMAEFGEAVRAEWRPLVEEGDGARLLWFWQLAHGTGASYQAVSITAVRDWATWGALVARGARDPRFRAWQGRAWRLRRARHGPPPRGRPAPEDRGLEPVLAPAHPGRAARRARWLDGGGPALPRPLGIEAPALRGLVAAAVSVAPAGRQA